MSYSEVAPEDILGEQTNSYSEKVAEQMNIVVRQGQAADWTQEQYQVETRHLLSEIRQQLRGNIRLDKYHSLLETKWYEEKIMIYSWKNPENFLNRDMGEYNNNGSPNKYLLNSGRQLRANEFYPLPTVSFEVTKSRILKFDCLPNNTLVPLVNNRIKTILEDLAQDDVQFFPAKLLCSDGELEGYYFLNITHTIIGIDHEKSIYTKMKTVDAISGFYYLTYKPGCMGEHQLALDQEYLENILISEKIKFVFDKEGITGVRLICPEDYYQPFTASDLINEWKRDQSDK